MTNEIGILGPNKIVFEEGAAYAAFCPLFGIIQIAVGAHIKRVLKKPKIDKDLLRRYLNVTKKEFNSWNIDILSSRLHELKDRFSLLQTESAEKRNPHLQHLQDILESLSKKIIFNTNTEKLAPSSSTHSKESNFFLVSHPASKKIESSFSNSNTNLTKVSDDLETIFISCKLIAANLLESIDPLLKKHDKKIKAYQSSLDKLIEEFTKLWKEVAHDEKSLSNDLSTLIQTLESLIQWKSEEAQAMGRIKDGIISVCIPIFGGAFIGYKRIKECEKYLRETPRLKQNENLDGRVLDITSTVTSCLLGPVMGIPECWLGAFLYFKTKKMLLEPSLQLWQKYLELDLLLTENFIKKLTKLQIEELAKNAKSKLAAAQKKYTKSSNHVGQRDLEQKIQRLQNCLILDGEQLTSSLDFSIGEKTLELENLTQEIQSKLSTYRMRSIQSIGTANEILRRIQELDQNQFEMKLKKFRRRLDSFERKYVAQQIYKLLEILEKNSSVITEIKKNENLQYCLIIHDNLRFLFDSDETTNKELEEFRQEVRKLQIMQESTKAKDLLQLQNFDLVFEKLKKIISNKSFRKKEEDPDSTGYQEYQKKFNQIINPLREIENLLNQLPDSQKKEKLRKIFNSLPVVNLMYSLQSTLNMLSPKITELCKSEIESNQDTSPTSKKNEEQEIIQTIETLTDKIKPWKQSIKDKSVINCLKAIEDSFAKLKNVQSLEISKENGALESLLEAFHLGEKMIETMESKKLSLVNQGMATSEITLGVLESDLSTEECDELKIKILEAKKLSPFIVLEKKCLALVKKVNSLNEKFEAELKKVLLNNEKKISSCRELFAAKKKQLLDRQKRKEGEKQNLNNIVKELQTVSDEIQKVEKWCSEVNEGLHYFRKGILATFLPGFGPIIQKLINKYRISGRI